ncbi:hypothetical protein GCM10023085_42810 [Actinomadura viridis]|uniref:Leucine rich repeat (LRR) protein n=1 Tax=Actinomadura viridis TaxID=58110 RepID=A0A931GJW2_9ACTN|nr:hypothetical protein [Actinomadura viridis]MBG6089642.1 hypothetical protein [Actinomadura viridis]
MIEYAAEVERILGGPPGKVAFRALCAALEREESPPDLIALCDERLGGWPDEVREAPWSWLAALEAGYSKAVWPLVRALDLRSERCGIRAAALPDPRMRAEVRSVTHLNLGLFAREQLSVLADSMEHWPELRSVHVGFITDHDADLVAALGRGSAVTRLESLNLLDVWEDLFHFGKPPFRPKSGTPWRLRHAGMRAPDLVHLIRSGLVPDLRSADVLVSSTEEARALADCAELARLDRLAIGFRCGHDGRQPLGKPYFGNIIEQDDQACEQFFAHADLANLQTLRVVGKSMGLGSEGLGARGLDAIAAGGFIGRLTELSLELLPLGDGAIARVLEAIDRDRIEKLTLTGVVATDRTAQAIAAGGALPRLRHLDLSRNQLGAVGAGHLAVNATMPTLEYLDLSGSNGGSPYYGRPNVQPVGDSGAEAWAASPNAAKLAYLNLSATGVGTEGLSTLMESKTLTRLHVLDLSFNPVTHWPETLANAPVWRTLRTLNVAECGLGDDDIEALTAITSAPDLRSVSLAYNSVGSRGARALASWAVMPQLWELDLHDNVIGDDGLIALATSRTAQRLLELDLEQDCGNAGQRMLSTPLPRALLDPSAFPSLDALFLGVVDEYHGARYSSGFPRHALETVRGSRPELAAFLTHLDIEDSEEFEDIEVLIDHDFRTKRATSHAEYLTEARTFAQRMLEGDIDWPPAASPTTPIARQVRYG